MDDLISIIVPVYNTYEYIAECIESVICQSVKNWELILVDDGSTDKSGEVCDWYKERDKRIHVIHQKNAGQSKARNCALKLCKGNFLVFLDSDDRLTQNSLEWLYRALISSNSNIACGAIAKIGRRTQKEIYIHNKEYEMDSIDACKCMFIQNGLDSNTFAKMYRAFLWDNVRFPEGNIFEDVPIMYKIFLKSEKVIFCNKCVYEQRSRTGSTTRSDYSEKKGKYVEYSKEVYLDIKKNYPEIEQEAKVYYLTAVIDTYITISCSKNKKQYEMVRKDLYEEIKKNWNIVLKYPCLKRMHLRIKICKLNVGYLFYQVYQAIK